MKSIVICLLVIILALSVIGCGSKETPAAGSEAPVTVRVALEGIGAYERFADKFQELAEKKLGNKVDIVLYKGGSLGNQSEVYQMVDIGELEMAIGASAQASLESQYRVFDFPYVFSNRDHMERVMKSSIPEEIHQKLLKEKNVRTLTIFDAGFRSVANSIRPIVTPDDLNGISIRTPEAKFRMQIFEALGATPTPIPYADLYLALEQRVVDGFELPLADIYRDSLYEVSKYLSLTNHIYTPCYLIADEAWWQTLPKDVQNGLMEAANEAADYTREIGRNMEQEFTQKLKEAGMQVNEINVEAFRKRAQETIWAEHEKDLGDLLARIVEMSK